MTAVMVCVAAFCVTFAARSYSRSAGLIALLFFGYLYGILRANILMTGSHFIFDSAALAMYIGELRSSSLSPAQLVRENRLRDWVVALAMIPSLLLLLPKQEPLVQLVGYRSAVMFLPFILIGARLGREELRQLAIGIACLNLMAFAVAMFEYVNGIAMLYPVSPVTSIIYKSTLANASFYRIPATFSSSASYGGTMVYSLPLIGLAISGRYVRGTAYLICLAGLAAAIVGVFLSASRSTALLAMVAIIALIAENRRAPRVVLVLLTAIVAVGFLVANQPRLQRFLSLSDTKYVSLRFAGSMNVSIVDVVTRYPLGNGLGAGGTSLPYFLENRVRDPVSVENEYGRLTLEQGVLGVSVWIGFVLWVLIPSRGKARTAGNLTMRFLIAAVFCIGVTGTGFLSTIPGTVFLFLMMGSLFNDRSVGLRVRQVWGPRSRTADNRSLILAADRRNRV